MRELINICEADVINFADRLNAMKDKPKSFVPAIHRQNQDMKNRAIKKLDDIKNKGHNHLAAKLNEEEPYVRDFWHAYMDCALWSSTNSDNDEPFDHRYGVENISPETQEEMLHTCKAFIKAAGEHLEGLDADAAGHDLWLTQNHHGAGFWDRSLEGNQGEVLTDLAHRFGEANLYVGDDGDIHQEHHMPQGVSYT